MAKNTPKSPLEAQRRCLRCAQMFPSSGPSHRICVKCSEATRNLSLREQCQHQAHSNDDSE